MAVKSITVGATVNLGNYENLKVEISAEVLAGDNISTVYAALSDALLRFGEGDPQTRQVVESYCRRVLGWNPLEIVPPRTQTCVNASEREIVAGEVVTRACKPPVPGSVMAAAEKVVVDGKDIKPVYKVPSETHEKAPVSEAPSKAANDTATPEKVATLTACEVCGAGITAGQAGVSHMLMNKAMCKDCMKAAGEK